MDKVYNISCSWQLDTKPTSVPLDGKWVGQFICKDNKIFGVAYETNDNSSKCFLIVGSFVHDKGIVITKISTEKKFDTTSFKLHKTGNAYSGTFAIETQFGSNVIGKSMAEISQAAIFVDPKDVELQYRTAKKDIQELNGLGKFLLNDLENPARLEKLEKELENLK